MALGVQTKGGEEAKRGEQVQNSKEELIQKTLLENYQSYYRLAFSYVHQEADAMDIVQEGAYKAMRKACTLREEGFVDTWIYRIMINTAKKYLKKYRRTYEELDEDCMVVEEESVNLELWTIVDQLPVKEKTLIILRYYEDKTLMEIADILQENINTVKSRLYRTLEKLRRELL
ncbi:MAG: sigma-70 family RNA polymerase sigma factor [Lachnospiraceae bacterium]|nr:sigma-70 family RNA polymerase sigma factor [Lachnospiraceae bacterium]